LILSQRLDNHFLRPGQTKPPEESIMPLQDKLDEYKKGFEAKAPKEALAVIHRATKDLIDSGILARTIKVGDLAPDFVLKNTGNQDVSLGELAERGPVVLSVYRGRW
jgi:hypothetical protein